MTIAIPGKVVVFDYGEVISTAPSAKDRAALVELAGSDHDVFWPAYWRHRHDLDQGTLGIQQYWRGIEHELGERWDDERVHRLWLADFRSWLTIDPGTLQVLLDLKAGGTRLALLSNAGRDFGSYFRHGTLGDLFDQVFVSGELGTIKPNAEIFTHVLKALDIAPAQTIFIDNKEENVRGAAAVGIAGHVFTTAAGLRSYLETLAVDSPR